MMRLLYIAMATIFIQTHARKNNESEIERLDSIVVRQLPEDTDDDDQKVNFQSLDQMCELFQVPRDNCTCETFSNPELTVSMCSLTQTLNKTRLTLEYSPSHSSVYATVTIIASLVGGLGNFGILVVAYVQRRGLPRSNILFAQLATVDFIFALVQVIVVIPLYWTNRWVFGPVFCKVLRGAMAMGGLLTIGFILNITIERFIGIIYPLKTKRSSKKTTWCLTLTNMVAGFLTVVPLIAVLRLDSDTGRCREHWEDYSANQCVYNWFLLVVYFLVPVLAILVLYVRIICHLKSQEKINKLLYVESERRKKVKRNQRIMFIIVSILIAFVVCILPNRAIWIYFEYYEYKVERDLYIVLTYISYLTYPFHVAFNPIIYSLIDKNWRKDIINVFLCRRISRYRAKSSTVTQTSSISSQDLRINTRAKLSVISEKDWESKTRLMLHKTETRPRHESTTL